MSRGDRMSGRTIFPETRVVLAASALIALLILALAVATTLLPAGAAHPLRQAFSLLCHGLPSRSFRIDGVSMPLCSRCSGIYGGMIVAAIVGCLAEFRFGATALFISVAPMALDGLSQASGSRVSFNLLRLVTGLLAGTGFIFFVASMLQEGQRTRRQTPVPVRDP